MQQAVMADTQTGLIPLLTQHSDPFMRLHTQRITIQMYIQTIIAEGAINKGERLGSYVRDMVVTKVEKHQIRTAPVPLWHPFNTCRTYKKHAQCVERTQPRAPPKRAKTEVQNFQSAQIAQTGVALVGPDQRVVSE
ncbi:hypothetical protein AL049_15420 [Pseudomonas syringae pv. cerasicola]|nr:hypothetical protein AL049_15420 [Pseudomonas syringae pv. cerasicola]PHN81769.1 hypothetical protein AO272_22990 [Pseudomonas syringae pv. cerasicola]PHN82809.1 hypothetical protein AO252_14880 [Pseudomonas syringae pv. cerasicola]